MFEDKTFEDILSKNDRIAYNFNILKNGICDKSKDLANILSTVEHFNFNGKSFRKNKFEEASIDEYNAYLYFYNLKENIKNIIMEQHVSKDKSIRKGQLHKGYRNFQTKGHNAQYTAVYKVSAQSREKACLSNSLIHSTFRRFGDSR